MAAIAGATAVSELSCTRPVTESAFEKKLIYRTMGKTGLNTPIVSMGIYDNTAIVPYALQLGVSYIHSSGAYRNGNSERALGTILKNRPRNTFILSTGCSIYSYIDPQTLTIRRNPGPETLTKLVEDSLERLDLGYIDIFYIGDMPNKALVMYEPFMQALEQFKRTGQIKFTGVACHRNESEVLQAAADSRFYDVVMTAYNFRHADKSAIKSAIEYAANKGLGIVAMKTQAGVYWDSDRKRMINMKAALKWVLQDTNVHTSVPAFSNSSECDEDISVMNDLTLSPGELDDLSLPGFAVAKGLYCPQCRNCLHQCPDSFDIPALMRSYMYAYGYQNAVQARETIDSLNLEEIPCLHCTECRVHCSMGFDIKRKVTDLLASM